MATSQSEFLDGFIKEDHASLVAALVAKDWNTALSSQQSWLLFRSMRLAAQNGVNPGEILSEGGLADRVGKLLDAVSNHRPPQYETGVARSFLERQDGVKNVLESLQTLIAAQDCFQSGTPNATSMMMLAGAEVGRADVMLTLVEQNHWRSVASLRVALTRRNGGRPKGYRPLWEEGYEPQAIQFARGQERTCAEFIRHARRWHEGLASKRDLGFPATDKGIGDGIRRLAARNIICLKATSLRTKQEVI